MAMMSSRDLEQEILQLRKKNEYLNEENKMLRELNKRLLDNHLNCDQDYRIPFSDNNDVKTCFDEFFRNVERQLPIRLKVTRMELWPVISAIFQTSFKCCRKAFIDRLTEPLYMLTKLSEKEDSTGETDWDRRDELDNVFTAYASLLAYSQSLKSPGVCQSEIESSKLGSIDRHIVDKVVSCVSNESNRELMSKLHNQVERAVELCWRMQMLPTPMFICQPTVYNDEWHDTHRKSWSDEPNQELVYYRPVLMNSAGGTIASRGLVGKRSQLQDPKSHKKPTKSNLGILYLRKGNDSEKETNILDDIKNAGVIKPSINCIHCKHPPLQPLDFKFVGNIKFLHDHCYLLLQNKR